MELDPFVPTTQQLLNLINDPTKWDNGTQYPSLQELLEETDWSIMDFNSIIPKQKLRAFCKGITNKEVRLDVMRFLHDYANYYFYDGAVEMGRSEWQGGTAYMEKGARDIAEEYIRQFQSELATQINQIEKTGLYSGNKIGKLEKRIKELEKQVEELKKENENFSAQLYKYQHPHANGKYIPEKLDRAEFYNIMSHLADHNIVRVVTEPDEMGIRKIICYQWDASKVLFGYFVTKVNDALELRGARVPYDWKVFEPAINNYGELIKEARKAFSTYNNSSSLQQNRIKNAEFVDEAIIYKELPF